MEIITVSRNPFVNQVGSVLTLSPKKRKRCGPSRNPFVNQVGSVQLNLSLIEGLGSVVIPS